MKKNLSFILTLFLSISTASAQVDFVWGKQFCTSSDDQGYGITIGMDSNIYVSGSTDWIF
jgi:hypothetical protein